MTVTTVSTLTPGTTIQFRSKNPNDTTVWIGTLEIPLASYNAIKSWLNPKSYNEAVRQVDSTVPSDATTLSYFMITVSNNATVPTTEIFAQEWIASGSLAVITPGNKVTIVVQDPANNTQAILSLLASAGYASTVIS